MSDNKPTDVNETRADQAAIPLAHVRRRSAFSFVWILPIVAAIIGAYLAFTTLSQRGPEIVINFKSADGLTAGQTKVRHKAVDLGTVTSIRLAQDMSHVIVHVRMNSEANAYLTDKARFWVVRPRLSASNISGLETLISGGYIEMDPGGAGGKKQSEFTGLEDPPGVRSDEPGTTFVLKTPRIGSLGSGSPVFYRDIPVGEVLGYHLPEGNGLITVNVFVRAPYDAWVRTATRFWNASGINIAFGGSGLHVELESIQAVLSGGVAFNTPEDARDAPSAKQDASFELFPSENDANAAGYKQRINTVMYFQASTSGLANGSPVLIYGQQVGTVSDVKLELDPVSATARVRVTAEIQPERLVAVGTKMVEQPADVARHLVDHGMRAELATTSYITGALAISLEFPPNPEPATTSMEGDAIVLPTLGGGLSSLITSASEIMQKVDAIPFTQIGNNANALLSTLNATIGGPEVKQALNAATGALVDVQGLVKRTDAGLTPLLKRLPEISNNLDQTLSRASHLVGSVDTGYGSNSQFSRDLERLMSQFNDAARSIRLLANFLDAHPEALIRGRTNQGADR
jgi:paraquat-inducible protein B